MLVCCSSKIAVGKHFGFNGSQHDADEALSRLEDFLATLVPGYPCVGGGGTTMPTGTAEGPPSELETKLIGTIRVNVANVGITVSSLYFLEYYDPRLPLSHCWPCLLVQSLGDALTPSNLEASILKDRQIHKRPESLLFSLHRDNPCKPCKVPLSWDFASLTTTPTHPYYCDLDAAILHKGSRYCGHYVLVVWDGIRWLMFDDDKVSEITSTKVSAWAAGGDVSGFRAHILVYRHTDRHGDVATTTGTASPSHDAAPFPSGPGLETVGLVRIAIDMPVCVQHPVVHMGVLYARSPQAVPGLPTASSAAKAVTVNLYSMGRLMQTCDFQQLLLNRLGGQRGCGQLQAAAAKALVLNVAQYRDNLAEVKKVCGQLTLA